MRNGRHTDLVRRFPPDKAEAALRVMVGDYGTDTDHPWHRLERGELAYPDFRELIAPGLAELGLSGAANGADQVLTQPKAVVRSMFEPDEGMFALAASLRQHGIKTGVLTNNVREFRPMWRDAMPFDDLFDDVVDSHEVGLRKPNAAIYQLAMSRLGVSAGRTAFLDDVASNVAAATNLGLFGIVVGTDPTPAIAAVRTLAGWAAVE